MYTTGYAVHYATFMAARSYLVVDNNSNQPGGSDEDAKKRAEDVFKAFNLARFMNGIEPEFEVNPPDSQGENFARNTYVGVFASFEDKIIVPGAFRKKKDIKLTSEGFLGREPTRAECIERVCTAMSVLGGGCDTLTTLADNGC